MTARPSFRPGLAGDKSRSMQRQYYVYILSNKRHTVFYVGVTNDLVRRVFENKQKLVDGFTKKYNIDQLLYFETCANPEEAIVREKQMKDYRREKKFALINKQNPTWKDLYSEIS